MKSPKAVKLITDLENRNKGFSKARNKLGLRAITKPSRDWYFYTAGFEAAETIAAKANKK